MAEAPSDLGSEEQEDLLAEEGTGLTTQWSVEDEEEVAREQRRRERMKQDQDEGGPYPDQPEQEALPTLAAQDPQPSPPPQLADRTESLNRSIEKSNTVKKSQPALPIAKIDERLEQYTQAIESAGRTPKLSRQASIELPSMAVASTKSLWETGEMQTLSSAKTPSCKDIVAGDMSKKSLWELRGDPTPPSSIKATPSGKRYKFVATGHGKYEKVLVDEGPVP
nr:lymphocyte-specific protein 1 [Marmota flaviventris]